VAEDEPSIAIVLNIVATVPNCVKRRGFRPDGESHTLTTMVLRHCMWQAIVVSNFEVFGCCLSCGRHNFNINQTSFHLKFSKF
jgi:hypothetical protein